MLTLRRQETKCYSLDRVFFRSYRITEFRARVGGGFWWRKRQRRK
ncbi:unnamed protein product [Larinioides sclopetarius]|uniref:Uncharacterized protein n=1 Tax=Larinioides sclopetarius TaxID=280406 RepID=A0AAV2AX74_9ARAC